MGLRIKAACRIRRKLEAGEIILLGQDVEFFMVKMQAVSKLMARQMIFYKNHLMTKKIPNKD